MHVSASISIAVGPVRRTAHEALADVRANLFGEWLSTTVNRNYYAALSAVRALLILDGVNPEPHGGAVTRFGLLIRTKLLPVTVAKDFTTVMARRTDVDVPASSRSPGQTPRTACSGQACFSTRSIPCASASRAELVSDRFGSEPARTRVPQVDHRAGGR